MEGERRTLSMNPWWESDAGFRLLVLLVGLPFAVSLALNNEHIYNILPRRKFNRETHTRWKTLLPPPDKHDNIDEERKHSGSDNGNDCAQRHGSSEVEEIAINLNNNTSLRTILCDESARSRSHTGMLGCGQEAGFRSMLV